MSVIWIFILFIPLCWCQADVRARGGSSLSDGTIDLEVYSPVPRNPVKQEDITCDKDRFEDAYTGIDLDYYLDNYVEYWNFVNTNEFGNMSESLKNDTDTKVCYNVQIHDDNGKAMGAFTCPLPFEHHKLAKCCGHKCAEFCCAAEYYSDTERSLGALAFSLLLLSAIALGLFFYFILGGRQ